MTTITNALSSILGTIADKALWNEEKREITQAAVRVSLIHKTAETIAETATKAVTYKAQSETHAQLYDAAQAEVQKRLDILAARRNKNPLSVTVE